MSWIADLSPSRKRAVVLGTAAVLGVAVVLGGGFAVISGTSHAAAAPTESCQGLDQALQNNLNFIAQQQAHPDSQSAARIANRQAVVDQIQQRRKVAGCTNNITAQAGAAAGAGGGDSTVCQGLQTALQNNLNFIAQQQAHPDAQSPARIANRQAVVANIEQRLQAAGCSTSGSGSNAGSGGTAAPTDTATATASPTATAGNGGGNAGAGNAGGNAGGTVADQVCNGSTVTLSGESGTPSASSNQFPTGTLLKVTNLDNNLSITVPVTSVSGSCVLLNNDAFNQIHQAGKELIRHALIEKVSK